MPNARGFPVDHVVETNSDDDPNQVIEMLRQLCSKVDALAREVSGKSKSHLTVEEVAKVTGRSPYTVRRWITSGVITATRVSAGGSRGRLLIAASELAKLIDSGKGSKLD